MRVDNLFRVSLDACARSRHCGVSWYASGQIDAFARVLRGKLLGNKAFAKQYLRLLVTEIRVEGKQLLVSGSNAALAQVVAGTKMDTPDGVPTFSSNWLPEEGSNLRPAD